jgi:hypothetical protein
MPSLSHQNSGLWKSASRQRPHPQVLDSRCPRRSLEHARRVPRPVYTLDIADPQLLTGATAALSR